MSASVVDAYSKLRWLNGARVADASILRVVISGNNATRIMVSEKAADLISQVKQTNG